MAIQFLCACGRILHAETAAAGTAVRCPDCGALARIPVLSDLHQRPTFEEPPTSEIERDEFDGVEPDRDPPTAWGAHASLILGLSGFFCNLIASIPAIICGIVALSSIARSKRRLAGKGKAVAGLILGFVGTAFSVVVIVNVLYIFRPHHGPPRSSNMRQLGYALHNYHAQKGGFPPPAICDKNGKPLLSWRVAILPLIEQEDLYHQFKLDEPWDSPRNKSLIPFMPRLYYSSGDEDEGHTHYKLFVGRDSWFQPPEPGANPSAIGPNLAQVEGGPIGHGKTILLVDAEDSVIWTKPEDIWYDAQSPIPPLGSLKGSNPVMVITWDGALRTIPKNCDRELLHPAINRKAAQPVDWDKLQ